MSVKIIFVKAVNMIMKDTLFGESFRPQGILFYYYYYYYELQKRQTYLTSGDTAGFMPGIQRSLTLEDQSL